MTVRFILRLIFGVVAEFTHTNTMTMNSVSGEETIGLFGATSPTGREFLKLALDAGYTVRALVPKANVIQVENDKLFVVVGDHSDEEAIDDIVSEAQYVVCMASDTVKRKKENKEGFMAEFIKLLYPMMREYQPYLFLYQATSLCIDGNTNSVPLLSNVTNKTSRVFFGPNLKVKDNNEVIRFLSRQQKNDDFFNFIVTRPGLCREGASKKQLFASKSQPGPIPVTYADLARFTLGALKNEKLYNKCPYVVGDGF